MVGKSENILIFKYQLYAVKRKMDGVFSISLLSQYVASDAYGETLSCRFLGLLSQTQRIYYYK